MTLEEAAKLFSNLGYSYDLLGPEVTKEMLSRIRNQSQFLVREAERILFKYHKFDAKTIIVFNGQFLLTEGNHIHLDRVIIPRQGILVGEAKELDELIYDTVGELKLPVINGKAAKTEIQEGAFLISCGAE